jgi:hypothetical protein
LHKKINKLAFFKKVILFDDIQEKGHRLVKTAFYFHRTLERKRRVVFEIVFWKKSNENLIGFFSSPSFCKTFANFINKNTKFLFVTYLKQNYCESLLGK